MPQFADLAAGRSGRRHFIRTCAHTAGWAAAAAALPSWAGQAPQGAVRPSSAGPASQTLIDDLVAANRILANEGVLDGFGHVSVRHDRNPGRYLISRSLAPALVTADDILEYDLDSRVVDNRGRQEYAEVFIHGEIYRSRPDVHAVVHNHSPSVIPFSVTGVPIRPIFHMSAFVGGGVPVFDIQTAMREDTDLLIRSRERGAALASTLGAHPAALLRGHGCVVVAGNVKLVTFNSVYLQVNAALQQQAMQISPNVQFLSDGEATRVKELWDTGLYTRAWDLWRAKAMGR